MAAVAAEDGGGNDSDGAPIEAWKATDEPQKLVVVAKKMKRTKHKSKSSPEAAGGSSSTVASPGDGEAQQQRQPNNKMSRLIWTTKMHDKFVKVCKSLGEAAYYVDAVPKKIMEKMNDPIMTRERIARHLQKYRNKERGQLIRRRGNKPRGLMMCHGVQQPLEAAVPAPQAPPPALHPPQAPFASTSSMSQPQIGHGQLIPNCSGNNVVNLLHQHPNFIPMVQPIQHCFAPDQVAAMQQQTLMMERQSARMQQAAAASGYNHMILRNYSLGAQVVASAPAPPGGVQGHHPEPQMKAFQPLNMSGERSVPEANGRYEQTEVRMAPLQFVVKPEEGQEQAAEPGPAFAAPANPDGGRQEDSCDVLRFWINNCEPSMDYVFPPSKPT